MSTHLLLFLLFLSLHTHATNARHHGLSCKGSRKNALKVNHREYEIKRKELKSMLGTELESELKRPINRGGLVNIGHVGASTKKPKELKPIPKILNETRGKTRGAVRITSLVAVSGKLPQKKHGKYPGFELDYARPSTHPPSHN
ncbi:hypothetical protein AAC387_Pa01g3213 [Persea americana]